MLYAKKQDDFEVTFDEQKCLIYHNSYCNDSNNNNYDNYVDKDDGLCKLLLEIGQCHKK